MLLRKSKSSDKTVISRYISNDSMWVIDLDSHQIKCRYLSNGLRELIFSPSKDLYLVLLKILKQLPETISFEVLEALLGDSLDKQLAEEILADLIINNI